MASYQVEVTKRARKEIRHLPGHFRQRVIQTLRNLRQEPRPINSRLLDTGKVGIEIKANVELHRIRMDPWRIIYVIEEDLHLISVLAVRKRPPYQYEDLAKLIENF